MTLPIVKRLRAAETFCGPVSEVSHLFGEAADAIGTLERQRLTVLASIYREAPRFVSAISNEMDPTGTLLQDVVRTAIAAIEGCARV